MLPVDVSVNVTVNGAVPLVGCGAERGYGSAGRYSCCQLLSDWPSVADLEPPGPVTVKRTVLVPGAVYWCTTVVPNALVEVPSPKCHRRFVIEPVDVSVNVTVNGAVPLVGAALNEATGAEHYSYCR